MASQWLYTRDGQKHGPFTSKQLKALARRGELLPSDLIWKEGMSQWVPAAKSAQLFGAAQSPDTSDALESPPAGGGSDLKGLTEILDLNAAPTPSVDPLLGQNLGDVTLVRVIAEGGMGRVYEGLQDKPRRPVAVKVLRPGFVTQEVCRRFDNEAEVLGRLRHPYIAQIYAAGLCTIVGADVPYFVMEYVADAMPLTAYAKQHSLTTRQRLELFRKVCEAVAHGHEKGVVHRDLKPSNILVEPGGLPKVIDFGIARSVDATPEQMTALTDIGKLIGTVQYMSPEQFSGDSTQIDQRSDVYALGVILYELLAGRPPYKISHKQIFEAAEVVRKHRPLPLSRLNRNIHANVVAVTGKCLQKDRRHRYGNAGVVASAVDGILRSQADAVAPAERKSRSALASARRFTPQLLMLGVLVSAAAVVRYFFKGEVSSSATVVDSRVPSADITNHAIEGTSLLAPQLELPTQITSTTTGEKKPPKPPFNTITNSIGMTLIEVPPGTFLMGSPISEPGRHDNENQVQVEITAPFLMSQTEVTQGQWRQVMGSTPWMNGDKPHAWVEDGKNYPACCLTWGAAKDFCERLTVLEREKGLISDQESYSLPTEAQWEYACRAGTQYPYECGHDVQTLFDYAWLNDNTADARHCHEVAMKKPNTWGLYDMHGNVAEWCNDFYAETLTGGVDPKGPPSGNSVVMRSIGWDNGPLNARCAFRYEWGTAQHSWASGLRVVRNIRKPD